MGVGDFEDFEAFFYGPATPYPVVGGSAWESQAPQGEVELFEAYFYGPGTGDPYQGVFDLPASTPVMEARTSTQVRGRVLERAAAQPVGEGRLQVCLIDAGQGSSGFYAAEVLKAAAPLFNAGTHCYLDHPTESESYGRPERTVRDLAGVLATDAVFRDGGLFADVRVFSQYRDLVAEMAPYIGMSIRAAAEVVTDSHPGGYGPVVKSITQVESVDFVTKAGRGGRIESVR